MDIHPGLVPGIQVELFFPLQIQGPEPQVGVRHAPLTGLPPLLASQGGDLLRQVGVVILIEDADLIPFHLQTGNAGVVAVTQAVHFPGTHAPDDTLKAADGRAVGKQGHRLAGMAGGNVQHSPLHPGLHLGEGFPALHLEVGRGVVEKDEPHGVVAL